MPHGWMLNSMLQMVVYLLGQIERGIGGSKDNLVNKTTLQATTPVSHMALLLSYV